MDTRIAVLSIIVENNEMTDQLNQLLHEQAAYVVGRMGIPYREKGVSVICVVLDAPQNVTSTLSGRIGMLDGIRCKAVYSHA
ncbi:MAG: TM1266 family iron-only hydrogenase system putative regulator [Lachnospiraceae bacterium]